MKTPFIRFTQRLAEPRSKGLEVGKLEFFLKRESTSSLVFPAVSGIPGHQDKFLLPGGPLPPSDCVIEPYEVSLRPIESPKKGIAGWLFPIVPIEVRFREHNQAMEFPHKRGNFAIHFDRNTPGSMGCICPNVESDWPLVMGHLMALGEDMREIPLEVIILKA